MTDISQFKAQYRSATVSNGPTLVFSADNFTIDISYDFNKQPTSIQFLIGNDEYSFFAGVSPESKQSYSNIPQEQLELLESLFRAFRNRELTIVRGGTDRLVDLNLDQDAGEILYLIESAAKAMSVFLGDEELRPNRQSPR